MSFRNFLKKGGSDFFHKKGGRVGILSFFILTSPFQSYLSLSVCCVCVLFIYTISVSIICVSQKEPSLTASNQQIWL